MIVSFTLFFTTPVTTNEGLAELIAAVDSETIGPFTVRTLKIVQQVDATTPPPASPTVTSTAPVTTGEKSTPSPSGELYSTNNRELKQLRQPSSSICLMWPKYAGAESVRTVFKFR